MPQPISLDEILMDAYKTYKPEELEEYKPTNYDRIMAMSVEELAKFLEQFGTFNQPCSLLVGEPLKWLQSEVEG